MCEPAIRVLRLVFTRLVQQNLFASVATLRFFFSYPTTTVLSRNKFPKLKHALFICARHTSERLIDSVTPAHNVCISNCHHVLSDLELDVVSYCMRLARTRRQRVCLYSGYTDQMEFLTILHKPFLILEYLGALVSLDNLIHPNSYRLRVNNVKLIGKTLKGP